MESFDRFLVFLSLLAPLASFLTVCLVAGSRPRLIQAVSLTWMTMATAGSIVLLIRFWNAGTMLPLDWISVAGFSISADLMLSNTSLLMLTTVSFISSLVHIYSAGYMAGDVNIKRFFAMLGFFTFAMQGIVLSDNLLLLFVFWELVGFSSYMLIGHWNIRPAAGRAATKAFLMNRIGDAGFLVGLMILWSANETFSISAILASGLPAGSTAASLCIFFGVVGKSAQFPLFTWLPDAMEGPTPVSALIHAATMVAAGVYLLFRIFGMMTDDALLVIAIVGMITTLTGALAALSQHDIKRILAYSTMSQLGLMVLAIGMGVPEAALLHLITHAFFKACLFLSAGLIIQALHQAQPAHMHFDVQDIRHMGGLRKKMPVTFFTFLLSGASLAGVPFFSGFLSKEAILTSLFMHSGMISWVMIVVILAVSFLTVLYTFRMIWLVFFGSMRTVQPLDIREPSWVMRMPVLILAFCSLWLLVSWNPFDFKTWMLPARETSDYAIWITLFSVVWVLAAAALSWLIFRRRNFRTQAVLRNAFYADKAYTALVERTVHPVARAVAFTDEKLIDQALHGLAYLQVITAHVVGWVDREIVDGTVNATARFAGWSGKLTRSFQGGNIQLYVFWAVFAIIIFLIWTLN